MKTYCINRKIFRYFLSYTFPPTPLLRNTATPINVKIFFKKWSIIKILNMTPQWLGRIFLLGQLYTLQHCLRKLMRHCIASQGIFWYLKGIPLGPSQSYVTVSRQERIIAEVSFHGCWLQSQSSRTVYSYSSECGSSLTSASYQSTRPVKQPRCHRTRNKR